MSTLPVPKHSPDGEHRYFVFCAQNAEHYYFATAAERDVYAQHVISLYLDDGWDEMVAQVVAGELTHACGQVDRVERPPAEEIDDEGHDEEGRFWDDAWEYSCNYELQPLGAPAPGPAEVLPSVAVEGRQLVIRITTECLVHAVTCASQWPAQEMGGPVAVIDAPVFVADIVHELQREDEQGTTVVHRLFDEAALAALEAGSLGVDYDREVSA